MTFPPLPPVISGDRLDHGAQIASEELQERVTAQRSAQATQLGRVSAELHKSLTLQRMDVAIYQADRAIANAKAQRLMSSLAGKFSLISKIQQSLG